MLLQGVVNLKNSPQEGVKQAYLYVFPYHLSTIADFIDMMYNYAMETKYFTEEQFNDMSHDTLVSLVMNMQNNMIEMQRSVDQLTEQIRLMNQRHFGRKTEKSSSLYEQLSLLYKINLSGEIGTGEYLFIRDIQPTTYSILVRMITKWLPPSTNR